MLGVALEDEALSLFRADPFTPVFNKAQVELFFTQLFFKNPFIFEDRVAQFPSGHLMVGIDLQHELADLLLLGDEIFFSGPGGQAGQFVEACAIDCLESLDEYFLGQGCLDDSLYIPDGLDHRAPSRLDSVGVLLLVQGDLALDALPVAEVDDIRLQGSCRESAEQDGSMEEVGFHKCLIRWASEPHPV